MEENKHSLALFSPLLYFIKKDRKKEGRGESLGQLEEAQDQRPRQQDLRGVIEWTGVNYSKVERLEKNLVNSL